MIKQISILTASIGLALGSTYAMAQPTTPPSNGSGSFVSAQVGYDDVAITGTPGDLSDHDYSYGIKVGHRWGLTPKSSLGFDVGYQSLYGQDFRDGNLTASLDADAWNAGINYRYSFVQDYGDVPFVVLRVGYLNTKLDASANNTLSGAWLHGSKRFDGWYAGVAGGYQFTPSFAMSVGYDFNRVNFEHDAHGNMKNVYVSASYRF